MAEEKKRKNIFVDSALWWNLKVEAAKNQLGIHDYVYAVLKQHKKVKVRPSKSLLKVRRQAVKKGDKIDRLHAHIERVKEKR